MAKSSNANGDFVTATLKCRTYGSNVEAFCTDTSGLVTGLGITGTGNALRGRLGGVRQYPLLVLSSLFLIPLSSGREPVLLSVVRSERKHGSVVVASRLPISD